MLQGGAVIHQCNLFKHPLDLRQNPALQFVREPIEMMREGLVYLTPSDQTRKLSAIGSHIGVGVSHRTGAHAPLRGRYRRIGLTANQLRNHHMSTHRSICTYASSTGRRISFIASLFFLSTAIPAVGSDDFTSTANAGKAELSAGVHNSIYVRGALLNLYQSRAMLCLAARSSCLKDSDCCSGSCYGSYNGSGFHSCE